jgi:hypothetical protein
MSYESCTYCNEDLYVSIAKDVKKQQLFMDLYVCITLDVKNQQLFMKPICGYYNGCKKSTTIYNTYMWVLHIRNGLMEVIVKRMYVLHVWFHENAN